MMKKNKDTCQNTLTVSGKKDLSMKELQALTCLSILSVQGVIYTHYKNKQINKGKYEKLECNNIIR